MQALMPHPAPYARTLGLFTRAHTMAQELDQLDRATRAALPPEQLRALTGDVPPDIRVTRAALATLVDADARWRDLAPKRFAHTRCLCGRPGAGREYCRQAAHLHEVSPGPPPSRSAPCPQSSAVPHAPSAPPLRDRPNVHAHPRKCAMVVKIPTATELTQLTPTEKLVAEALITGVSNAQGADDLSMSTGTFAAHVSSIGRKFQVTSRKGRAARAHAVLASGQVAPPAAPAVVPDFTHDEQRLLRALAKHPETHDIARAAEIRPADVRPQIRELVAKAGADNDTHLIGLGHAWGLLGAEGSGSSSADAAATEPGGAAS